MLSILGLSAVTSASLVMSTIQYEKDDSMRTILNCAHILLFCLIVIALRERRPSCDGYG